ncbi:MAG: hypothetical protein HPY59_05065 [Anaerolineae bacterium]|nr:hypothetical protein [Anaerolineae bacterium]
MAKTFYTEHDIEDLFKRGVMSLEVNDNVVLTDLAYERARRLGMALIQEKAENPPAAPVRPYIVKSQSLPQVSPTAAATPALPAYPVSTQSPKPDGEDLRRRIRDAVVARLGTQVDPKLLDVIITRVLASTGIK